MESVFQEGIGDERLSYRGTDENGNKENILISIFKFIGRLINNIVYRIKNVFNNKNMKKLETETTEIANAVEQNAEEAIQPAIDDLDKAQEQVTDTSAVEQVTGIDKTKIKKAAVVSKELIAMGIIDILIPAITKKRSANGKYRQNIRNQGKASQDKLPEGISKYEDDYKYNAKDKLGYTTLVYAINPNSGLGTKIPVECDVETEIVFNTEAKTKKDMFIFRTIKFDKCYEKMDKQLMVINTLLKYINNSRTDKLEQYLNELKNNKSIFVHDSNKSSGDFINMQPEEFTKSFQQLNQKTKDFANEFKRLYAGLKNLVDIYDSTDTTSMSIAEKTKFNHEKDMCKDVLMLIVDAAKYVNVVQSYESIISNMIDYSYKSIMTANPKNRPKPVYRTNPTPNPKNDPSYLNPSESGANNPSQPSSEKAYNFGAPGGGSYREPLYVPDEMKQKLQTGSRNKSNKKKKRR